MLKDESVWEITVSKEHVLVQMFEQSYFIVMVFIDVNMLAENDIDG